VTATRATLTLRDTPHRHRRAIVHVLLALIALALALPTGAEAQAEAIVRASSGKLVGRVRVADLEAQQNITMPQQRSGSAQQMLDSMKVERSSNRVRTIHADVDTLRVRVGDALGLPKAWGVDSAGYIVVDFVPLWSYASGLMGRRDGRYVVVGQGRFFVTVQPMRLGPSRPTDPQATVIVLVAPR
jgi:hypothetical protein